MDSLSMNATEEASILQSLRLRKQLALAMLSVLLYEYAVTCKNEYRHIWRKPFNVVLGIYLFSRYFALTFQVVNTLLVLIGPLSEPVTSERTCSVWIAFQVASTTSLVMALDIILMLRRIFKVRYNSVCEPLHMHPSFKYLGVAGGVLHIWLAILTAAKWNLAKMGIPVAKLVARDSAWTITLVFVLLAFLFPYSIRSNGAKAEINFMCPTTLISIATCRVIMNMRTLAFQEETANATAGLRSTDDLDMIYLEQLNVTDWVNGAS
ncbi:hypothetical protein D9613_012699 [Agrocybe pediades]|uniref:DUF6533 domain-containing protein n=1 Tax=Agrocybe pediades TaxID=84607 RepID=A0A8H4VLM1_9AGAR|nr:hypothetical protein D9613_012699 [Agrocybe pediades]